MRPAAHGLDLARRLDGDHRPMMRWISVAISFTAGSSTRAQSALREVSDERGRIALVHLQAGLTASPCRRTDSPARPGEQPATSSSSVHRATG